MSLSSIVEMARSAIGGFTWGPAVAVAKTSILAVFSRIEKGTLLLDERGGKRHVFGQRPFDRTDAEFKATSSPRHAGTIPRVELIVNDDAFWMRLFLFADMGFAEAYMLGEFDCQDLTSFFQVNICIQYVFLQLLTSSSSLSSIAIR